MILHTLYNGEYKIRATVAEARDGIPGKCAVILRDLDAREYVSGVRIFKTEDAALTYAKKIACF